AVESALARLGQLFWLGLPASDVPCAQPVCAVSPGQTPATAQPARLAASTGCEPLHSSGTPGIGGVVSAFWQSRLWRESDGGNLHVRFDEGEGSGGHWPWCLSSRAFLSTLLAPGDGWDMRSFQFLGNFPGYKWTLK